MQNPASEGTAPARGRSVSSATSLSLNAKVVRLVGIVKIVLLLGNAAILGLVIWPAFDELQRNEATQNLDRVLEAIASEKEDLGRATRDFSAWDSTYNYVRKHDADYDHQTFNASVMQDLEMQLIAIYDVNGRRVNGKTIDLRSGRDITIKPFNTNLPANHSLLARPDATEGTTDILITEDGPMLLASFPILPSSRTGPARGSFLMGRLLTKKVIEGLADQTHVSFDLLRTDEATLAPPDAHALTALLGGSRRTFGDTDGEHLPTYALVSTLMDGKPLLVKAKTPVNIHDIGLTTLAIAGISTVVISLVGLVVFWTILRCLIVGPINSLTNHVVKVGQTGDLSQRMAMDRNDEIGVLSKEFNAAVEQLENVRRRLLEKSYQSGMAEIAAGVIHNVRNALSPVVVTVSHLSGVAVSPPAAHLDTAFADLKSPSTPPERRKMLVEYVEAAMQTMLDRGRHFAESLKTVAEQNRHIEQILHDHTALSMGTRRLEPVSLGAVVDEAARFIPSQVSTIVELRVSPSVALMPPVHGHTIVVTQILGNLMVNAAESIREAGRGKGLIEFDATREESDGRAAVHLIVRDNGNGIDPAVLPNLFGRGFSTKKGKTGGIGLHWSANSIAAMGGQMYAESPGIGHGASFHVVLPVAASKDEGVAA